MRVRTGDADETSPFCRLSLSLPVHPLIVVKHNNVRTLWLMKKGYHYLFSGNLDS